MLLLFMVSNSSELYELMEKMKDQPDTVNLLTDPFRWFLWSIFIQPLLNLVNNLNDALNVSTELSFVNNHVIYQVLLAFIALSVAIVIVVSSFRHIKNLFDGAESEEFKEIIRRTVLVTAIIAIFIPVFSIVNTTATHFNNFAQNIGQGDGMIKSSQYKTIASSFYRSPFIQDFCGDKERSKFDINEKERKPLPSLDSFELMEEYYCYKFNFWLLLGGCIFAIIGLFIILCQMLLRVYRIAVLYVVMPLMYALGVSDNLEYISKRASRYLYGSIFQVGFQLLSLSLGSIVLGYLFELFINKHDYAVFIAFVAYIVFIIKIPKMVGDLFGIGIPPESMRVRGLKLR